MKAFTTVLSVAEIHAARAFYEDLFLELYQDYSRNLTFTCGLSLQQDFHWLTGLSRAQIHPQPNNMELAFETEDLDGFLQKLRAYPHLQTLGGVVEHPWGQRVIRFYDLDGHLIEVGESMKLVIRRFQAAGITPEEDAIRILITSFDERQPAAASPAKLRLEVKLPKPYRKIEISATRVDSSRANSFAEFVRQGKPTDKRQPDVSGFRKANELKAEPITAFRLESGRLTLELEMELNALCFLEITPADK